MNPIEQLWAVLKRRISGGPALPTVDRLWEWLEQEWWSIDQSLCRRLVESMPRLIEAVIKARGGHIRS